MAADDERSVEGLVPDEEPVEATARERGREALVDATAVLRVAWADWRTRFGVAVVGTALFLASVVALHQSGYEVLNALLEPIGSPWTLDAPAEASGCDAAGRNCEAGFEPQRRPFEHWETPLGTTGSGRGLLRGVVWGSLPMVQLLLAGATFATGMATLVGVVAGYRGGVVDSVLMTLNDVVLSLPGLPFVVVLLVVLEPSSHAVVGVLLASTIWPALARSIRATVLEVREREYVEAARSMGLSWPTVVRTAILPSVGPSVVLIAVLASRRVLFDSVGLYLLEFVAIGSGSNWGAMLRRAYVDNGAMAADGPRYMFFVPLGAIVLLAMGLVSLSLGTDRLFDPRARARIEGERATDGDDGEGEDDAASAGEGGGRSPA